jgi:hypothetical protein
MPKNAVSMATPIATTTSPARGYQSSPTTPATTKPANAISKATHHSEAARNFSSLALLTLFPMRHGGRSSLIKPALIGFSAGALMVAILSLFVK